jgi:hypothetical protein
MTARSRTNIAIGLVTAVVGTALLWAAPGRADSAPPRPLVRRIHVRVWDAGAVAPSVSVNIPVALVTATLKVAAMAGILDRSIEKVRDEALADAGPADAVRLHLKARDIVALWTAIVRSGPADLVSVEDGQGGRVQIRID